MAYNHTPPKVFTAGDSVSFSLLLDKPASSATWALSLATQVTSYSGTISASSVDFSATGTATLTPGLYLSAIIISYADGTTETKYRGQVRVYENPLQPAGKTQLEIAWENNEASIVALTSQLNSSVTADSISAAKRSLGEALSTRKYLAIALDAERRAMGRPTLGYSKIKHIQTRF